MSLLTDSSSRKCSKRTMIQTFLLASFINLQCLAFAPLTTIPVISSRRQQMPATLLWSSQEDDINRQLERAREVLAVSKAKLEARAAAEEAALAAGDEPGATVDKAPLFATNTNEGDKRDQVIKSRNEITGLFTTDGEKMAKLSEGEQWEVRSLEDVFQNEREESDGVYSLASKQLAERDVAASIFNLRKAMTTEDYRRVFDKKNRFIGEDN